MPKLEENKDANDRDTAEDKATQRRTKDPVNHSLHANLGTKLITFPRYASPNDRMSMTSSTVALTRES